MSPERFVEVGKLLYGQQWLLPMAYALKINLRRIRRMAAGTASIPDGVAAEIADLCAARINQLIATSTEETNTIKGETT